MWIKENPHTCLWEYKLMQSLLKTIVEVPQIIKKRTIIQSSIPFWGIF